MFDSARMAAEAEAKAMIDRQLSLSEEKEFLPMTQDGSASYELVGLFGSKTSVTEERTAVEVCKVPLVPEVRRPLKEGKYSSPQLDDQGRIRIPGDCDPKYRWWQGGQSPFETLLELGASDKEIEAHIGPISTPEDWRKWRRIKNTAWRERI